MQFVGAEQIGNRSSSERFENFSLVVDVTLEDNRIAKTIAL
jgi:hypothetical protein